MANEKRLDLIDRNELLPNGVFYVNGDNPMTSIDELLNRIANAPTVDAVSRGVHEIVRWERDIAIGQLESYGISLGEKADVAKVVHGRWISSGCGFDCCSECRKVYTDGYFTAMGIKPRAQFNYCPNCGAKMDGGNEDG